MEFYRSHVLVCGGTGCTSSGSPEIISKFESEIAAKSEIANKLKSEMDQLMKYLGDHQALDVFVSISDKNAHLKTKLESLKKYQSLQSEYKDNLKKPGIPDTGNKTTCIRKSGD